MGGGYPFLSLIRSIPVWMAEALFPVYCLGCKKEGDWVCKKCAEQVQWVPVFDCPVCHRETSHGEPCAQCPPTLLSFHIAVGSYREGSLLGQMLEAYKYDGAKEIERFFEQPIVHFIKTYPVLFQSIDVIVPVPLHKRRFAERGYNQSETIARIVSDITQIPSALLLERTKKTKQQARLSKEERADNVHQAFVLAPGVDIVGKRVLLVDDVYTTGSTIVACAETLLSGGAKEVIGFSLLRA